MDIEQLKDLEAEARKQEALARINVKAIETCNEYLQSSITLSESVYRMVVHCHGGEVACSAILGVLNEAKGSIIGLAIKRLQLAEAEARHRAALAHETIRASIVGHP